MNIRLVLLALILVGASYSYAQQDSLKRKAKYFIGFNLMSLTSMNANASLVVGGRGGLYIGKRIFLGGRAAGIVLNDRYFTASTEPEFGYIGPMAGYHLWRKNRFQASVMAAGGLGVLDYGYEGKQVRDRTLFILPSVEIECFLAKNIALAVEVGYRSIQRASRPFSDEQLSGLEYSLVLKLGRRP